MPVGSPIGVTFCADPAFQEVIARRIDRIRADVRAQRQAGKLIIFASTPISPRGGGDMEVNLAVAASVKARLEREYGGAVWVLNPGSYQGLDAGGKPAGGGEYMVMWTAVLAGEDGTGRDFDMAHFTGPADVRRFFGCTGDDVSGCLGRWIDDRAARDARFRAAIAESAERRAAFVRYYTLRGGASYSTGAHDEWNIMVKINRRRPLGEQIAVFFDGRPVSPAEMETEISPGYSVDAPRSSEGKR